MATKKIQLVWDQELVDQVDSTAALAGLSRTEWLRLAATYVLEHRVKMVTKPPAPVVVGCPHPKELRQQLAYGTVCGRCHVLVR